MLQQGQLWQDKNSWLVHDPPALFENQPGGALYLNALDEVSHREVVVEEDANQHLHHFTVEFERKVMRQDQLSKKKQLHFLKERFSDALGAFRTLRTH